MPAIVAFGVLAAILGILRWQVLRALGDSANAVTAEHELRISVVRQVAQSDPGFEAISAPADFYQATTFQGKFYICGPAGLLEYDARGQLLKQYRVGHDLPASPLLRMATGVLGDSQQRELLIATEGEGVLAFNGDSFRLIRPEDPDARTITAILPLATGQLLLGTRKRGVLVYDGKTLHAFHPTLAGLHVTALAGSGTELWVGTLDQGIFHWQAGRTIQINQDALAPVSSDQGQAHGQASGIAVPSDVTEDKPGLPDSAVYSIAIANGKAYAGTALGVAELEGDHVARVFSGATFAQTLYVDGDRLLAGSLDRGLVSIPLQSRPGISRAVRESVSLEDAGEVAQVFVPVFVPVPVPVPGAAESSGDAGLYALSQRGLYERGAGKDAEWKRVLSPADGQLNDTNVSALAIDKAGRIWVGYFDHGLDLIEPGPEPRAVRHLESDDLFCINRIVPNLASGTTAVATANGLVLFDAFGRQRQALHRADGLIADHVTDVAAYGDGMAVATPAGLTFLDEGGARSMYAFHGLVNNHVYALGVTGDEVVAGTLGGISVLRHERVLANYTTANPGLKQNWISAIVRDDDGWMIGTYGSGVLRMSADGHFESFDVGSGKFEVNPNAMLATDSHIYAGSLGQGLYSYDRKTGRWSVITGGLPSLNVTALAANQGYLYIGTANGLVRIPEQSLP